MNDESTNSIALHQTELRMVLGNMSVFRTQVGSITMGYHTSIYIYTRYFPVTRYI